MTSWRVDPSRKGPTDLPGIKSMTQGRWGSADTLWGTTMGLVGMDSRKDIRTFRLMGLTGTTIYFR
eukprot:1074314-Amorphochlora_amoeboformis.AAC.1